jgi:deazaflavin-dependent oxidoreductase (nitroreductase family)
MSRSMKRGHVWLYRRSGGRLLGRMGGQRVLLLTTQGRRTGRSRTTPVQCSQLSDDLVVVASNRGARRPPAWYLNLRADPEVTVELGREKLRLHAGVPTGAARPRLWSELIGANRWLERTERRAGRLLPLVVLERT